MPIVVVGATFVDVKGFPLDNYIPSGRNAGFVEIVHGGVSRNISEDLANLDLNPVFLSIVDDNAEGESVVSRLSSKGVNTKYIQKKENGMGMWLAVFDETGDIAGSISRRPNMAPIIELLEKKEDSIFQSCDSIVVEVDIEEPIVNRLLLLAKKYNKKIYGVVSNISIASERREAIQQFDGFICNEQEAEIFFADSFSDLSIDEFVDILLAKIISAKIPSMIVTLGSRGSIFASANGEKGFYPAKEVNVRDTTGAGDAYCAGVVAGMTYGKTLEESVEIGTRLASSVITVSENVCPKFQPEELGLIIK